jgi:hypothetical protein
MRLGSLYRDHSIDFFTQGRLKKLHGPMYVGYDEEISIFLLMGKGNRVPYSFWENYGVYLYVTYVYAVNYISFKYFI